jgi:PPOX class probable FMN-dependent enzyme
MTIVDSIDALERLYEVVVPGAVDKVRTEITPRYREWIDRSRFVVLSTVGPAGTDASPRGDSGPVVRIVDPGTLWLPDWRGNNRLDSLRNIVEDGRVSLMFMVPGSNNVVRINGRAVLSTDLALTGAFDQRGKHPRSVIVVTVAEAYFQCAKALMRSRLWQAGDDSAGIPTAGEFIKEYQADFDARAYDEGYADYAKDRMW